MPLLGQIDLENRSKGWLVEHAQDTNGLDLPIRRTYCDAKDLAGLSEGGVYGYEAIGKYLNQTPI
ncbi:MAG: hypothetical protein C4294_19075 [Nitrospiraceae bacterium]